MKDNVTGILRPFYHASYKIPALLHVTQESRKIALRRYTYAFKQQMGGAGFHIHFETDAIYVENSGVHFHMAEEFFQMFPLVYPATVVPEHRLR